VFPEGEEYQEVPTALADWRTREPRSNGGSDVVWGSQTTRSCLGRLPRRCGGELMFSGQKHADLGRVKQDVRRALAQRNAWFTR